MPQKLIVLISGRKQSGKDTLANQIAAAYLNAIGHRDAPFFVTQRGKLCCVTGTGSIDLSPGSSEAATYYDDGVRFVSFAEPLKRFCVEVLGLEHCQVWGSDADKNALTHLLWDDLPDEIRFRYAKPARGPFGYLRRRRGRGYMTGREVLQVFGTDMIRQWDEDAWANAGHRLSWGCPEQLVIINDGRFPNEVWPAVDNANPEIAYRIVRLLRSPREDTHRSETAMDNFPTEHFDAILPPEITVDGQQGFVEDTVCGWFEAAGLVEGVNRGGA